jgi:bacterioferritin-associated ferredoxin
LENFCCCSTNEDEKNICPVCNREGQKVSNVTVQNMLLNTESYIDGNTYYICLTPNCMVAYYDNKDNTICESSIKVPIWFKDGANPKYACYCSKVTQEDVIKAVVKGARDVKSVAELTGAMKNGNCIMNNPTGKCCHSEIQRIIDSVI